MASEPPPIPIGRDRQSGFEVCLPYAERDRGLTLIGKSGTGKSSLLEQLILADLSTGTPGIALDPHGLLAERVVSLAPQASAGRLVLLDPSDSAFGLNLLECHDPDNDREVTWAADGVVETVKKLYGEDSQYLPRLEKYLDLAARTLIPSHLTLADVSQVLTDDQFRRTCLAAVHGPTALALRRRWAQYDSLRQADQVQHIEAVVNRLDRLLAPVVMQQIVGNKTTIPFDHVLNGHGFLILSLSSEHLTPDRCDLIGRMVLCELARRVFARKVSLAAATPPRLHLYVDEFQRFATTTTAEFMTQGRKYGVGLTLALQNLSQVVDPVVRGAVRGARTLILFPLSRPDADELVGELPARPREEWVERVEEQDGFEPETIFSPTPALDVLTKSHSDPAVLEAAAMLFEEQVAGPRKSQWLPHPALRRHEFPFVVRVRVHEFDDILIRAMSEGAPTRRQLASRLLQNLCSKTSAPRFFFDTESADWLDVPCFESNRRPRAGIKNAVPDMRDRIRDPRKYNHYDADHHVAEHNQQLDALYARDSRELQDALTQWFDAYRDDLDAWLRGEQLTAFATADLKLMQHARENGWEVWDGRWQWRPRERARPVPAGRTAADRQGVMQDFLTSILQELGYQLRWLHVLCEGLARNPIVVPTTSQRVRLRTHHIVHARQTEQDALNELAARLVNPDKRYTAHVRLPVGYHEIRLLPPIEGEGDQEQLERVRDLSRRQYGVPGDDDPPSLSGTPPSEPPPPSRPPTITRRPPVPDPRDGSPDEEETPPGQTGATA